MNAFQERVVIEKSELDEKLERLRGFYTSSIFFGLSDDEKERLNKQEKAMRDYSQILGERIAHFRK